MWLGLNRPELQCWSWTQAKRSICNGGCKLDGLSRSFYLALMLWYLLIHLLHWITELSEVYTLIFTIYSQVMEMQTPSVIFLRGGYWAGPANPWGKLEAVGPHSRLPSIVLLLLPLPVLENKKVGGEERTKMKWGVLSKNRSCQTPAHGLDLVRLHDDLRCSTAGNFHHWKLGCRAFWGDKQLPSMTLCKDQSKDRRLR